jgi:hypothetical protein
MRPFSKLAMLAAVCLTSMLPTPSVGSAAHASGCYAEVWYVGQTHGHTYEYRCGGLKLHAGELVRVPVRNYVTSARIDHISRYRTYFGGPLKTVRAVIS